jgi:hypothetical protein
MSGERPILNNPQHPDTAIEARPGQEQPLTADSLLAPGKIEALVKSGRIPGVIPCRIGGKPRALVMIPPEGTQFGDRATYVMGSYRFESPDGKGRGVVETLEISTDQIIPMRERIANALDEQPGLPTQKRFHF